ncbi:MAG: hypothetical protein EBU01_15240, partial [Crocinitomicaceae bacterium]|nr:hypothetical protein [Crocinitomicaceae bacterium]
MNNNIIKHKGVVTSVFGENEITFNLLGSELFIIGVVDFLFDKKPTANELSKLIGREFTFIVKNQIAILSNLIDIL